MSAKVKELLKRLEVEVDSSDVKRFIEKELKALENFVEEVFAPKHPELCGHGAGEPPAGVPVEAPAAGNDAPAAESVETATTPAPDAGAAESAPDAGAPAGEADGAGDTTQPATSAPSEAETAPAPVDAPPAE